MAQITTEAEELRRALQAAVAQAAVAFDTEMTACGQPKDHEPEKTDSAAAIEQALHHAAQVPLQVAWQPAQLLWKSQRTATIMPASMRTQGRS